MKSDLPDGWQYYENNVNDFLAGVGEEVMPSYNN